MDVAGGGVRPERRGGQHAILPASSVDGSARRLDDREHVVRVDRPQMVVHGDEPLRRDVTVRRLVGALPDAETGMRLHRRDDLVEQRFARERVVDAGEREPHLHSVSRAVSSLCCTLLICSANAGDRPRVVVAHEVDARVGDLRPRRPPFGVVAVDGRRVGETEREDLFPPAIRLPVAGSRRVFMA